VSRCRAIALGTILTFTVLTPLLVTPDKADAGLLTQLRHARHALATAHTAVVAARQAYLLAQQGNAAGSLDTYRHKLVVARAHARSMERAVRRLSSAYRRQQAYAAAVARGDWAAVIKKVAAQEHVSAAGLTKMMKLESGGRASARNGVYCGLFQYCASTWHAAWNPWRHASIWSGEAQIRATARAIHRGYGPSMWPNTYRMAF
jgi:hypothetical protein